MTQPSFVPIVETDQVRPAYRLKVPTRLDAVATLGAARHGPARGRERFGVPGPDQGSPCDWPARFEDRLVLAEGESAEDAMVGCTAVAMRRCARFGRAPVVYDLEFAFTLWGFLGGRPRRPGRGPRSTVPVGRPPLRGPAGHRRGRDRGDAGPHARARWRPARPVA